MQTNKDKQETLLKTMKLTGLALAAGTLMAVPNAFAENAASKYGEVGLAAVAGAQALDGDCTPAPFEVTGLDSTAGFCLVLDSYVKNSGSVKDLVMALSAETTLWTDTKVSSQKGNKSTAVANASIEVFITVDGNLAKPGVVTFDRRGQTLIASLGGVMDTCTDGDLDGIITLNDCTFTDEQIELILDTTATHTFNFLAYDIGSGSHTVEAYARLTADGSTVEEDGLGYSTADASASLGKATLSVWEVHGGSDSETEL